MTPQVKKGLAVAGVATAVLLLGWALWPSKKLPVGGGGGDPVVTQSKLDEVARRAASSESLGRLDGRLTALEARKPSPVPVATNPAMKALDRKVEKFGARLDKLEAAGQASARPPALNEQEEGQEEGKEEVLTEADLPALEEQHWKAHRRPQP